MQRRSSSKQRTPLSSIRSNIEQGFQQHRTDTHTTNTNSHHNMSQSTNSNIGNRQSFKLASNSHDTPPVSTRHGTSRSTSNSTNSTSSNSTESTLKSNIHTTSYNINSIHVARETRAEAQMKRLEYAQRKAQQQQQQQGGGEGSSSEKKFLKETETKKQEKDLMNSKIHQEDNTPIPIGSVGNSSTHPTTNTTTNTSNSSNSSIRANHDHPTKHIMETFQQQIEKQQQQIDELKFFHELDQSNNVPPPPTTTSTPTNMNHTNASPSSPTVQQLQHQITFLTTQEEHYKAQMEQLKSKNIDLQATLQALNPKKYANQMTSSEAYKKALRLQSDLLDSKNLLQEESLRRERAETNLDCFKLEANQRMTEYQTKIQELEQEVQERVQDLDDGVNIMKGLEEEILETKALLEEEEQKNDTLMEQFEAFEKEKEYLTEQLTLQLQENQQYVSNMERRFDEEKRILENQCVEFQKEVDIMKERVKDMEEKRKAKDEMMDELQDLQDDMEATIKQMQMTEQEHQQTIADLEDQLEQMKDQVRNSNDKVAAMEQVVATYHENTSIEIQEYASQLEEAHANEAAAREELQEYLSKLKEAQEEIETLCSEMETIHEELEEKRAYAVEADQQIASLTESFKSLNSDKAKQHQYMRDKKKWSMTERTLRQELEDIQREFAEYKSEHSELERERDELNKECFQMDDENRYLKEHVKSLEAKIDKYCSALEENETESMNQIKSLEQELHRVQASASFPPNARHRELNELKAGIRHKDEDIQKLKRMLEEEKQLVAKWKHDALSNRNSTSSAQMRDVKSHSKALNRPEQVYSPFDGFEEDDVVKPFTSELSLEWDEMDNHRTVGTPTKKGNNSPLVQKMVTPDAERRERASIENDAVRRYMRQRRKNF